MCKCLMALGLVPSGLVRLDLNHPPSATIMAADGLSAGRKIPSPVWRRRKLLAADRAFSRYAFILPVETSASRGLPGL